MVARTVGAVGRFALQLYSSDRAYETGLQVAAALVALLCVLLTVQQCAPAAAQPTVVVYEACDIDGTPCW